MVILSFLASEMEPVLPSLQTLLEPYQALITFKRQLQQCRDSLTYLRDDTPSFIPNATELIDMANGLLARIEPELQRLEQQLLEILLMQLQHSISYVSHLPNLDVV